MLLHRKKSEIQTGLSPESVRLQLETRMSKGFIVDHDSEFCGIVYEESFKICKNPRYKLPVTVRVNNSFSPVAVGTVSRNGAGSLISLNLRMNLFVCVFVFLFELASLACAVLTLLGCFMDGFAENFLFPLVSVLFFLFIELLIFLFFRIPADRLLARLEEIFSFE